MTLQHNLWYGDFLQSFANHWEEDSFLGESWPMKRKTLRSYFLRIIMLPSSQLSAPSFLDALAPTHCISHGGINDGSVNVLLAINSTVSMASVRIVHVHWSVLNFLCVLIRVFTAPGNLTRRQAQSSALHDNDDDDDNDGPVQASSPYERVADYVTRCRGCKLDCT